MPKILEQLEEKFTKYEVARILGARALQIAMDAPLLLKIPQEELEEINFNPLEIAKRELLEDVLPITVKRPIPKKKEEKLKILTKQEIEELKKREEEEKLKEEKEAEKELEKETNKEAPKDSAEVKSDEMLEKEEVKEERDVEKEGEIMELSKPEDEADSELEDVDSEDL